MARFYYTTVLGENKVSNTEINSKFANIGTAVNSTKFSNEQFKISSGRYRHLKEPGSVMLYKKAEGTEIGGGSATLATKNGTAWNVLSGLVLTVQPTNNNLNGGPVGYICCEYESVKFTPHDYELAIGYSVNGSTYSEFRGSSRWFGKLNTHDPTPGTSSAVGTTPLWTAKVQDPFNASSSVTYRPKSSYAYKPLFTAAPIGAGTPNASSIVKFAPMIRAGLVSGGASYNIHMWDVCKIWLVLEDNGL